MGMSVDLTTFASSAKPTESARCPKSNTEKVGLVGTMIVGCIRATAVVTAELCVDKTGLESTLLVQVVDSGLARSGLAVIFLSEGMDSQMRQMMPKRARYWFRAIAFLNNIAIKVFNLPFPKNLETD